VVTVTKQAVPLSGCPFLHFKGWLGSAVLPVGAAHSIIFGSGGEMRFGVSTHHSFFFLLSLLHAENQLVYHCRQAKTRLGPVVRLVAHAMQAAAGQQGFRAIPAPPATYTAFIFRLLLKIAVS
jgi:hypothetical protein